MPLLSTQPLDSEERKPTFRQWVRLGELLPQRHLVQKVWLPGYYKNYTFETERFRLNINEDNGLYEEIPEFLDLCFTNDLVIFVADVTPKFGYSLDETSQERTIWQPMGDFGYKIGEIVRAEPLSLTPAKRRRDAAKPKVEG